VARIPKLSSTLTRSLGALGHAQASAVAKATRATIAALAQEDHLPGVGDDATRFAPGRAFVRRVRGHNVWLFYRFDAA